MNRRMKQARRTARSLWQCTMGKDSDMNLLGKIVLFPLAVFAVVQVFAMEFLFAKLD